MLDLPSNKHPNIPSTPPPEVPPSELTTPTDIESSLPNPESEDMEVHHHNHHEGKKTWRAYIWEFLMLFLAVFCGFLAEYQLEHKIEQDREKRYMQSMLEDLKVDTAKITKFASDNDHNQQKIDSLIHLIHRPDRNAHSNTIYYFARIITVPAPRFELNDRTYEQMKSSGMLRLIRDRAVSDSVSTYYANQTNFKQQEEVQLTRMNTYFDAAAKVFDGVVFQDMMEMYPYTYHRPEGNPPLLTSDPAIINEFIVKLHYFGGVMLINSSKARQQRASTEQLIRLIESTYHLD